MRILRYIDNIQNRWVTAVFIVIALFWYYFVDDTSKSAIQRDILAQGDAAGQDTRVILNEFTATKINHGAANGEALLYEIRDAGIWVKERSQLDINLSEDTELTKYEVSGSQWRVKIQEKSASLTLQFQEELKRDEAYEWISHNILYAQIKAHVGNVEKWEKIKHLFANIFGAVKYHYKGKGRLLKVLGTGMNAIIFEVVKDEDPTPIAVKVFQIHPKWKEWQWKPLGEFEIQKEAYEENEGIQQYLVKIMDFGQFKYKRIRFGFAEMEIVEASEAHEYLQQNGNFVANLGRFIVCLSSVMLELNKIGITHRDIKNENVLMTDTLLKLIDFGYSDYHTLDVGTFYTRSPLQFYDDPGELSNEQAYIPVDTFGIVLSVLDSIDRRYKKVFTKYYDEHSSIFAPKPDPLDEWLQSVSVNLAYMYRQHEEEFVSALQQEEDMPPQIINFVRELIHGDLKFKWCEPDDFVECYAHWTWVKLIGVAVTLH